MNDTIRRQQEQSMLEEASGDELTRAAAVCESVRLTRDGADVELTLLRWDGEGWTKLEDGRLSLPTDAETGVRFRPGKVYVLSLARRLHPLPATI